ncbi:uncharacterized protein LOC105662402 [Megachile rotundata]|uniref:uncharacterized protein LOC105662402 n=1 Tax=Megachile rotundata TaxID=143995 RepID=UPI003FD4287E
MQVESNDIKYCINKYEEKNINYFKNYSKKAFLSVIPSTLKFTFDSKNFKIQKKIVEITNYFSKPCPIQLLPPETQYFQINNISQKIWLNPGSVFKMNILFIPDENRGYNDVLKIRYFYDQLIEIKIFAEVVNTFSFPTIVNFGNVPLDHPVCYEIPIHPNAKKEFTFAILPTQENSCVDICPRWGRMRPGQKPLTVMIIYRPLQYISMHFQVRIFISDLCKTPHTINFYACTRPGLLRESIENAKPEVEFKKQQKKIGGLSCKETKSISRKKDISQSHTKEPSGKYTDFDKMFQQKCSYIPLYSLHAINCILNSKTRSFNEYELTGPLGTYLFEIMEQKLQHKKEFFMKIENRRNENEQIKFHHKPTVTYDVNNTDEKQITEIKIHRERIWDKYTNLISNSRNELFERQKANKFKQRILRIPHKV